MSYDGCSAACIIDLCPTLPEVLTALGDAVVTGDSCAAGDHDPGAACGGTNTGGDYAVTFTATLAGTYTFDTENDLTDGPNQDTVTYARDARGGEELGCNDDTPDAEGLQSTLSLPLGADETVVVYFSGFAANCVEFELDIAYAVVCGDGLVGEGEECYDGNIDVDDGCAADCTVEPFCGDSALDDGEECDDDGVGDACDDDPTDDDADEDGIVDGDDNCPDVANAGQGDADDEGVGDACDDEDGDGSVDGSGDGSTDSVGGDDSGCSTSGAPAPQA
ncbi:MAG: cysteine-rich repeat protein [Bradymonadia bacterium]